MTICFRNVAGQRDRSQIRPCEAHLLLQIWNKGSASYMNCWVISPAKRERKYDLRRDKIESCLYISRCETKVHCQVTCPANGICIFLVSETRRLDYCSNSAEQTFRMNIPGTKAERIHLSGNLYIMVTIRSISAHFIFPTKMKN